MHTYIVFLNILFLHFKKKIRNMFSNILTWKQSYSESVFVLDSPYYDFIGTN